MQWRYRMPGSCFTNILQAFQKNLAKIHNARNPIYGKNLKLKLCMCAQSHALGTRTTFQLDVQFRQYINLETIFWRAHEILMKHPLLCELGGKWQKICMISISLCSALYSDITWASLCLKSLTTCLFVQQFVGDNNKENIKVLQYWLLWGEI